MARLDFLTGKRVVLAGAAAFALLSASAAAAYPRLYITALGQHADRLTVAPHEPFHVTIRVHVTERVDRFIDELVIGDLDNCTITGDERVRTPAAGGTDFTERLTLEARVPGTASISAAYIDAVDPANGKAARYSSNAVTVRVTGGTPSFTGAFDAFAAVLRWTFAAVAGLAALFVIVAIFVARRPRRAPPVVAAPPQPARAPLPLDERLRQAAAAVRERRDAASLTDLRALLFERAGAPRGATLVDALRSLGPADGALRTPLLAADRAVFGPAAERARAIDDLLAGLEAYFGAPAPNAAAWNP